MNTVEHHIFLVNSEGRQAPVCSLRIQTADRRQAIRIALSRGFKNFNVIEEADAEPGCSSQQVARVRSGVSNR